MPQPRKTLPRYLKHASGKGRIVWTDPAGVRREKMLPGPFNSPESLSAFARLQLELAVSPAPVLRVTARGPTVAEVLVPYLRFVEAYHAGSHELKTIKYALTPVRELYALTPAADFGPLALKAVREAYVRLGWARSYCNRQVGRVIRAFKWAAAEEIVPATVYQALKTLAPLRAGKTDAPESAARQPAVPANVEKTMPHLPPHVRALVELLRITGMRPSEACRMTLGQIDRSGPLWKYEPTRHKLSHKGKGRLLLLGETAQAVIVAHLGGRVLGPDEPLFSPRRQRQEIDAEKRSKRVAKRARIQPSQVCRKKAGAVRLPGEWYTAASVGRAVQRACELAEVPTWYPYQLRHLVGAELREKFSLEHVRAALGHSHASMSAHYAKGADLKLAAEVAAQAG